MSAEQRPVTIVTDSLSVADPFLREQLSGALMYPFITGLGEKAKREDEVTPLQVIDALLSKKTVQTSAPNPEDIKAVYQAQPEDTDIVHICPSRKVSGWYLQALAASGELERKIEVFDASASAGTGLYVGEALRLAREGKGAAALIGELHAFEKRVLVLSLVHDPQYLDTGGRAKTALAKIVSLLKMQVILDPGLRDEATIIGQGRPRSKVLEQMIEKIQEDGRPIEHISFGWSEKGTYPQGSLTVVNPVAEAGIIWERLGKQRDGTTQSIFKLSPAAVVHVGPGNMSAAILMRKPS
jgi:DegV family protein with EDD domain